MGVSLIRPRMAVRGLTELISWLRFIPARIVFERKNLLNAFGPAARLVVKHFQGFANPIEARVVVNCTCPVAAVDAVEDRRHFEYLRASFEEERVERFGSWQRCHCQFSASFCASMRHHNTGLSKLNSFRVSRSTNSFKLPERKPSRSSVM